jgi:hypothetical protein
MRERSAGQAHRSEGHLGEVPACRVSGRRALRRSTCGVSRLGRSSGLGPARITSPYPGGTCAALRSVHVQPLKAAPSCDGTGVIRDDPVLWFAWTRDPGATPCSANQAHPRRRPQLSKACPEYRVGKRRKDYCRFECEFTGDRSCEAQRSCKAQAWKSFASDAKPPFGRLWRAIFSHHEFDCSARGLDAKCVPALNANVFRFKNDRERFRHALCRSQGCELLVRQIAIQHRAYQSDSFGAFHRISRRDFWLAGSILQYRKPGAPPCSASQAP